ncbi:MAG TPA: NAD(P)/FAD-dependent oxidoreductase [Marmoricola sp.]|nr:NAD(P)/FAD-dependent oxidoreductase [Marmoricola sp.]
MAGAAKSSYDVVVVGGGHNGLTAAAYLARAGMSVLVLERLDHMGGAAVSTPVFPGLDAHLSRYSYLVSLLPDQIARELGLDLELRSRPTASYSPTTRNGNEIGLLVEHDEGPATRSSFLGLTRADDEYAAWRRFHADVRAFAEVLAPTLTQPLVTAREMRERVDAGMWRALVERPLGEVLEERFADDLVRGVVATNAVMGTFADLNDTSLVQNRCFLYHVLGNGTGEWRVPVGGMGAVSTALEKAAARGGAELALGAGVSDITADADGAEVTWHDGTRSQSARARFVLGNVAPWVLRILMDDDPGQETKPSGSQLKINFLLSRLPRLKSGDDPAVAFAGTYHVAEEYSALAKAYAEAAAGSLPTVPPGELYCHSLTDDSVLGPLARDGAQTLTYFGVHMPEALFASDTDAMREEAVRRAIAAIDAHLEEPLLDCVMRAPDGTPCLEAKVPQDIERDLAMPGGHIFHGDLSWPWASNREALDTPAQQWGVVTEVDSVLLCGSGARRGGAVSGLGGHNAAQAVLAMR